MSTIEQIAQTLILEGGITATDNSQVIEIIFDNIMRHTINGHNNITNHYVEDGIAIQDTTTVDPLTLTVQGWMGDLVYQANPLFGKILKWLVQTAKIPIIGGIVATNLSSPLILINAIFERVRGILTTIQTLNTKTVNNKTVNAILGKVTGISGTRVVSGYNLPFITFDEEKKLGYQAAVLENLRSSRLPVDVSLPRIGVFHNMYVEDYELDQDKSYYQAKVTIVFKQVRTTQTILTRLSNDTVTHREAESR